MSKKIINILNVLIYMNALLRVPLETLITFLGGTPSLLIQPFHEINLQNRTPKRKNERNAIKLIKNLINL
jgi:methylmalonyl-CoA mutase N-terminal domain/subunit